MKKRCYNVKSKSYMDYGGRGIRVCERWLLSFSSFVLDMGPRPTSQHQLDRTDNDGNYEPSNCRWSTRIVQARNRRSNWHIEYEGQTLLLVEWAEKYGLCPFILRRRLKVLGWSIEKALSTPTTRHDGTPHKRSKLSPSQVKEIRILYTSGRTVSSISREFNIARSSVDDILNRRTYKWVE